MVMVVTHENPDGDALVHTIRAVGPVTRFDPSIFRSHNAAEVNDFAANDFMDAKRSKRLDRFGAFSAVERVLMAGAPAPPDLLDVGGGRIEKVGRPDRLASILTQEFDQPMRGRDIGAHRVG